MTDWSAAPPVFASLPGDFPVLLMPPRLAALATVFEDTAPNSSEAAAAQSELAKFGLDLQREATTAWGNSESQDPWTRTITSERHLPLSKLFDRNPLPSESATIGSYLPVMGQGAIDTGFFGPDSLAKVSISRLDTDGRFHSDAVHTSLINGTAGTERPMNGHAYFGMTFTALLATDPAVTSNGDQRGGATFLPNAASEPTRSDSISKLFDEYAPSSGGATPTQVFDQFANAYSDASWYNQIPLLRGFRRAQIPVGLENSFSVMPFVISGFSNEEIHGSSYFPGRFLLVMRLSSCFSFDSPQVKSITEVVTVGGEPKLRWAPGTRIFDSSWQDSSHLVADHPSTPPLPSLSPNGQVMFARSNLFGGRFSRQQPQKTRRTETSPRGVER